MADSFSLSAFALSSLYSVHRPPPAVGADRGTSALPFDATSDAGGKDESRSARLVTSAPRVASFTREIELLPRGTAVAAALEAAVLTVEGGGAGTFGPEATARAWAMGSVRAGPVTAELFLVEKTAIACAASASARTLASARRSTNASMPAFWRRAAETGANAACCDYDGLFV